MILLSPTWSNVTVICHRLTSCRHLCTVCVQVWEIDCGGRTGRAAAALRLLAQELGAGKPEVVPGVNCKGAFAGPWRPDLPAAGMWLGDDVRGMIMVPPCARCPAGLALMLY
jgi:hypothetical protein